jgi:D-erythrulose 4-kinase
VSTVIDEQVDELGRLDAVAGDGDHGIGMQRGAGAALGAAEEAVAAGAGAGTTLTAAGEAWADRAGGTSGALWGLALRTMGRTFGDEEPPDHSRVVEAVGAGADAVARRGKATVGDKTMLDAVVPFVEELRRQVGAGSPLADAWAAAAAAATDAARSTAELLPRLGRARPHQEKSIGTPDPGAVSFGLAATAVGQLLRSRKEVRP